MKKLLILLTTVIAIATLPSCSKKKGCKDPISIKYDKEAEEDDGSCVYGGTGGSVSLVIKLAHHGLPIPNQPTYPDTVLIKYNAIDAPSSFDDTLIGEPTEDHVHIPNMKPGKYYLRAFGLDTNLNRNWRVTGGLAIEVTQTSGEFQATVPVSE